MVTFYSKGLFRNVNNKSNASQKYPGMTYPRSMLRDGREATARFVGEDVALFEMSVFGVGALCRVRLLVNASGRGCVITLKF
jgi:hypothetical protein